MDIGSALAGAFVSGLASAFINILKIIPWEVWIVLGLGSAIAIAVLRVVTNPKVVLPLVGVLVLAGVIMGYRAHWISMGYDEAQTQVKAAQAKAAADDRTVTAVMNCYAASSSQLWDRTQMKCLRADGALP